MSGPRRIPSLDGLRALSIVLVLVSHLLGTRGFPVGPRAMGAIGDFGYLGVRVFFVISGFLITSLLLAEQEKTGSISLKGFYARRAWRIFPAFYTFVAAMVLAWLMGSIVLHLGDIVAAVTYTMNYHYDRSWELGHIWSLSIEEQFYMVWPAMFLIGGPRRVVPISLAMMAIAPCLRAAAFFTLERPDDVTMEAYPCVMDSIATGCLLAALKPRLDLSTRYLQALRSPAFVLVPIAVALANIPTWWVFEYTTNVTIQNIGVALCVDRCVRNSDDWIGKVLNWSPLVWLGGLSYSLYLWQEPFLNHYAKSDVNTFPLNVILAFTCAVASFYLVETPFLQWRDRRKAARSAAAVARSVTAP
ncbi:MAG TPA: acyltransferase [Kofleriaceae bacterium]|nr:acyltransferase [Kofleriaceae bacterium]